MEDEYSVTKIVKTLQKVYLGAKEIKASIEKDIIYIEALSDTATLKVLGIPSINDLRNCVHEADLSWKANRKLIIELIKAIVSSKSTSLFDNERIIVLFIQNPRMFLIKCTHDKLENFIAQYRKNHNNFQSVETIPLLIKKHKQVLIQSQKRQRDSFGKCKNCPTGQLTMGITGKRNKTDSFQMIVCDECGKVK
jgi:hypothetical protein